MVETGDFIHKLKADCPKCFGLCCVALYYSASEGFPENKEPGYPCRHLQADSRCAIYSELAPRGLKGCMAFDCFGAGQQVSQMSFSGQDWRQAPETAPDMFAVFLVMRRLHELLWYLQDALGQPAAVSLRDDLQVMLQEIGALTALSPAVLLQLDVAAERQRVDQLLQRTSELVRGEYSGGKKRKKTGRGALLAGVDLRKKDMRGANLRGACLIAADLREVDLSCADLIGADFRDTDIRSADLSHTLFLTQAQVNTARGDHTTRLPSCLEYPRVWSD